MKNKYHQSKKFYLYVQEWRNRNKDKVAKYRKKYYLKNKKEIYLRRKEKELENPERIKILRKKWNRTHLLKRYGLTSYDYQKLFNSQNAQCAICSILINRDTAKIDHSHKTGKVRGLLCSRCNVALGHIEKSFNDNGLLSKAIAYCGNIEKQEHKNLR